MPMYDEGTGGGTTTSVCTVSPSDQEAITNNLIKRISDIEKFLSRIVAADVYADNLADLARNLGNILNGTIMLPSQGSPYGVGGSIPVPDDFTGTFLSGDVITIWENGVVRFEVRPREGITTGGAPTSYLVVQPSTATITAQTPNLSNVLYSNGGAFGTSNLSTGRIDILESGYYHFSANLPVNFSTTNLSFAYMQVVRTDPALSTISIRDGRQLTTASQIDNDSVRFSFGFPASATSYIQISTLGIDNLLGTEATDHGVVTVEKMRST